MVPCNGWKNKKGTSDRYCPYGSWIEYYRLYTTNDLRRDIRCAVEGCNHAAEVGAHVYNTESGSREEYIAPLCQSCNMKEGEFSLRPGTELVSANLQSFSPKKEIVSGKSMR